MSTSRWLVTGLLCLFLVALSAAPAAAQSAPGRGEGLPEWANVYGGFLNLDGMAPLDARSAWAVNALQMADGRPQSAFVRQDGDVWRVTQLADGVQLTAVDCHGPALCLAVGKKGQLWRWDGARWLHQALPTADGLNDVALAGATTAWAVGDLGLILAWDGREWRRQVLPIEVSIAAPITSVEALSADEAWATSLAGAVLQWKGGWQVVKTPGIVRPVQIAFNGPNRAMVVGRGALELAGGAWRAVGDANTSYRSVAWVGQEAYVVANDRLVRYHDGSWTPVTLPTTPVDMTKKLFERVATAPGGAWAMASDGSLAWLADGAGRYAWPPARSLHAMDVQGGTLWAGGAAVTAGFVGQVGGAWVTQPGPVPEGTVLDLDLATVGAGWAVSQVGGVPGTTALWRWNGDQWAHEMADKTWLLSRVQALSTDEAWAGGGNVVARWRGSTWEAQSGTPLRADGPLSMLRGGDEPLGWFASIGRILRLDGAAWTEQPVATSIDFVGLRMVDADNGWAITPSTLFHYDGVTWTPVATPRLATFTFRDLDLGPSGDLWLLLDPPGLLHHVQGRWEAHDLTPLGGDAHFRRLRVGESPVAPYRIEVWLAGDPPTIARYRVQPAKALLYLPLCHRP